MLLYGLLISCISRKINQYVASINRSYDIDCFVVKKLENQKQNRNALAYFIFQEKWLAEHTPKKGVVLINS